MNKELTKLVEDLTTDIRNAYETSVTLEQAERLAAKFLYGQICVANALQTSDLDARMRKNGVKQVKAAVYLEEATKSEKKPTEAMLGALVDRNELVSGEQEAFDKAEVSKAYLENALSILKDGHIYFRGISKGRFE